MPTPTSTVRGGAGGRAPEVVPWMSRPAHLEALAADQLDGLTIEAPADTDELRAELLIERDVVVATWRR